MKRNAWIALENDSNTCMREIYKLLKEKQRKK